MFFPKTKVTDLDKRNEREREQLQESFERVIDTSKRQVERARSELTHATHDAHVAIDRRISEGGPLREAIQVLIDRKTGGKFELRQGAERRR